MALLLTSDICDLQGAAPRRPDPLTRYRELKVPHPYLYFNMLPSREMHELICASHGCFLGLMSLVTDKVDCHLLPWPETPRAPALQGLPGDRVLLPALSPSLPAPCSFQEAARSAWGLNPLSMVGCQC